MYIRNQASEICAENLRHNGFMKRLLLPLLAALALPTAVSAEEFTEIKPENIYSYKKSSLVKYENNSKRYIEFLGTTPYSPCFNKYIEDCHRSITLSEKKFDFSFDSIQNIIWKYDIDCNDRTFNRSPDNASWSKLWVDFTAKEVANKYCPIEEWSKLPNK